MEQSKGFSNKRKTKIDKVLIFSNYKFHKIIWKTEKAGKVEERAALMPTIKGAKTINKVYNNYTIVLKKQEVIN